MEYKYKQPKIEATRVDEKEAEKYLMAQIFPNMIKIIATDSENTTNPQQQKYNEKYIKVHHDLKKKK